MTKKVDPKSGAAPESEPESKSSVPEAESSALLTEALRRIALLEGRVGVLELRPSGGTGPAGTVDTPGALSQAEAMAYIKADHNALLRVLKKYDGSLVHFKVGREICFRKFATLPVLLASGLQVEKVIPGVAGTAVEEE